MYVKLRSWHIVKGDRTACGKFYAATAPRSDDFGNEKSCETCLRINVNNGYRYAARPA